MTIHVKPSETGGDNQTITVLLGDAQQPLQHPKRLSYTGSLTTPRLFLTPKSKEYEPLKCTLAIDAEGNKLTFYGLEKSHESADTIVGVLQETQDLEVFKLNSGARFTVKELVELFKRHRPFFANKDAQVELIKNLSNWNIAVSKMFEEVQNTGDGNARRSVAIKVEGSIPSAFVLEVAIYKGYPKETFLVEFGVDAETNSPRLYLDSPELIDLLQQRKEEYMAVERKYFTEWGCSVIDIS